MSNENDIYKGLVAGDECRFKALPTCEKVAKNLNTIIQDQSAFIVDFTQQYYALVQSKDSLYQEKEKVSVKLQKLESQKKHFSVGPYIGYDAFQNKASFGACVQYKIFSF